MTPAGRWATLELPWRDTLDILLPDDFDFLAQHVMATRRYFPSHFELALALAPPSGVILDLGAHLGTFALAAAASGRRVIAVEASPRNVDLLRESARANGLDDVLTVVPVAVSDREGTVRFQQEGAWGQITDSPWAVNVVEVPVRTVPDILGDFGLARVDVVKLDVEGSEIAAIAGMSGMLSAPDAPAVLYESNAHTLRMFDATPEKLIGVLSELGYDNYLVEEDVPRLTPLTPASFQPETNVDYAAVKGPLELPEKWIVRKPRTESDLARIANAEACQASVALRAQVARSLERAPASLLARRDVQLTLNALALDPDETVARAAGWWVHADHDTGRAVTGLAGVRQRFQLLGEQGRALRDRLEQIRIRWGARP
jgi:FkbM family methyltransferase